MWWLGLLSTLTLANAAFPTKLKCAFRNETNLQNHECQSCFTIWQTHSNGTLRVIDQGCWSLSLNCIADDHCIHDPHLLSHPSQASLLAQNISLCCCRGQMCNENFSTQTVEVKALISPFVLIGLSSAALALLATLTITIILKRKKMAKKNEVMNSSYREKLLPSSSTLSSPPPPPPPDLSRAQLSLKQFSERKVLSEGKFSTTIELSQPVKSDAYLVNQPRSIAVIKYRSNQAKKFELETKVYELLQSMASSSSFLRWYGSHQGNMVMGGGENLTGLFLCLELPSIGPLCAYLQSNTLDWHQMSKMFINISHGVAALHNNLASTVTKGGRVSVCHLNLNSSNILVRRDLSCCICNFSQAVVIEDGIGLNVDDNRSSDENVRYFAPELLAGCLNAKSLENSLKQVDVYASGLLYWEVSRRCRDLYQGVAVPSFEMAFQEEAGLNPTHEEMNILVAKKHARPLFPEVWKNSNPAVRSLKETIMESWDDDGEARLTSSCIKERFQDLDRLWRKYKLVAQGPPTVDKSWLNNTQSSERRRCNDSTAIAMASRLEQSFRNVAVNNRKNDNIVSGQRPTIRIQPHQGLNPCLERNYNNANDLDLERVLVMGSAKDKPIVLPRDEAPSATERPAQPRHSPVARPIPYLQNNLNIARKNVNIVDKDSGHQDPEGSV